MPLYLSGLPPASIRGALRALNQVMIGIGLLSAYLVDYALSGIGTWRVMAGLMPPEILPLCACGPAIGGAALLNWLTNLFLTLVFPVLLYAGAGAVFAIFAVCALLACVFAAAGLRETSGRSLEAIEMEQGFL